MSSPHPLAILLFAALSQLGGPMLSVGAEPAAPVQIHAAGGDDLVAGDTSSFALSATSAGYPDAGGQAHRASDLASATDDSDSRQWAWPAAIFFGLLTLASTIWLHKRTRTDLLTPDNARHDLDPGQPGGAPSA